MNSDVEMMTNTAVEAPRSFGERFRLAALLGSLTAIAPLSIDMYLPALPSMARDLHAATSVAQLSLTACLLGLAVGQLFAGPLSDALGRKRPLLVGLGLYLLASFACGVMPSAWGLVAIRVVQGLCGSAAIVIARAIARDLFSGSELTRFFSMLMLVNGVAPILAPVIGGQLLRFTTWRGVFLILGCVALALWIWCFAGLRETLEHERRNRGGLGGALNAFHILLRDPVFVTYAFSQGLVSAAMFGYISGSPFVLQDIYGLSPQAYSACFAANGIGIVIASQLAGQLARRVDGRRIFLAGVLLAAAGGIALLASVTLGFGLVGILPSLFILVSCVGIVSTLGSSLAMQHHARQAGSAAGLIGVAQLLLGSLATPLVGLGGAHDSLPMGVVIAVADVGALVWYAIGSVAAARTQKGEV
ncbi:multidrug effflux MFS transporter [Alicyclobacillus vulcanalis]|uniref:Bcr/CflA family efflux transporter n=1 Tax=Alicyclobacillus vulcanalis TaxID=252246 RepID=A0A1N7M3I4_9BACL|nr:multidrug effflux MFS transporter [Alicyclobacillus vulcanalis]SIS80686.1 MFS transporter, DHA1 family, bicyclomycin/chloramphenicol resistance protein [Alicyclobacillus vulcanalis]